MTSSHNILKVPIQYNIGRLKQKKQDPSKLVCAVRNFYDHQEAIETVENGKHPDDVNQNVRARRKIKEHLNKLPYQAKKQTVDRDIWKLTFMQRLHPITPDIRESSSVSAVMNNTTSGAIEDKNNSQGMNSNSTQLHENKALRKRKQTKALDKEWIDFQRKNVRIGS